MSKNVESMMKYHNHFHQESQKYGWKEVVNPDRLQPATQLHITKIRANPQTLTSVQHKTGVEWSEKCQS